MVSNSGNIFYVNSTFFMENKKEQKEDSPSTQIHKYLFNLLALIMGINLYRSVFPLVHLEHLIHGFL